MTESRLAALDFLIPLHADSLWLFPFTCAEVSALAIVTGTLVAGFIGWTAFIVDGSDSEQKRLMEALHLGQEQAG
jgi:hypothetical protein